MRHEYGNKGDRFQLYLDGKAYGGGYNWYMLELMEDWLITKDLYGAEEVTFKVKRTHKGGEGV